jgi:hypothetical protein
MEQRQPFEGVELEPEPEQLIDPRLHHFTHPFITPYTQGPSWPSFIGQDSGFDYNDSRHIFKATVNSTVYSFYAWKSHKPDRYWFTDNFTYECDYQKRALIRRLEDEENNDVTWPTFSNVLLSVLHFISYASNNYKEDPTKKKRQYPIEQRYVLFSEIFAAFCSVEAQKEYFSRPLIGLYFDEEKRTYQVLSAPDLYVPWSSLQTFYNILVDALYFLIHVGLVEITQARFSLPTDTETFASLIFRETHYSEVVHEFRSLLYEYKDISNGNTSFCFRVQTEKFTHSPHHHLKALYLYLRFTLTPKEIEQLGWSENVPQTFSTTEPYRCPWR